MRYELVIIWQDGTKDIYEYTNKEEAEQAGYNMRMALGYQITWWGVRPKR